MDYRPNFATTPQPKPGLDYSPTLQTRLVWGLLFLFLPGCFGRLRCKSWTVRNPPSPTRWFFGGFVKPQGWRRQNWQETGRPNLGGGFKHFYFHPYLGKWSNLTNIFQMGWNHQPAKIFTGEFCRSWWCWWLIRSPGRTNGEANWVEGILY